MPQRQRFKLEMSYPSQPDVWAPVPEKESENNIKMSDQAFQLLLADRKGKDPDGWYACSRGARILMLALEELKIDIRHADELLNPKDD